MSTANSVTNNEPAAGGTEQPTFIGAYFAAIGAFGFGAWVFYDLWRLEHGVVESVRTWDVIVLLYETLGFWPAVLLLPAFGLFCTYLGTTMLMSHIGVSNNPEITGNSMTNPQAAGRHDSTQTDDGGSSREHA
jgi:hypothetical protein